MQQQQAASRKPWQRWLVVSLVISALGFAVLRLAAGVLHRQVQAALGPEAEIGSIALGLTGVVVTDLRLRAPEGWPAADTLRARRVHLRPDLSSLWSDGGYRVAAIGVEGAYLSVLRTAQGRVRLLPSLLERPVSDAQGATVPSVIIGAIHFEDAELEFFDATVRRPAHRLVLTELQADLGELRIPALDNETSLRLRGVLPSAGAGGGGGLLEVDGWMRFASRESDIALKLRDVDLKALEPYLIQASESGVKQGKLDLTLNSTVTGRKLKAPGTLVLADLVLAPSGGLRATFMGMPRSAVIQTLKNRDRRIELNFTLEGDLDNPQFSLNEVLSVRVAVGVARTLGLSLEGVVRGIGSFGGASLEATGNAVKGMGNWITGKDEQDDEATDE